MSNDTERTVLTLDRIDETAIHALVKNDILALRVPNYSSPTLCEYVMNRLSGVEGTGYRVEPDFKKFIGGALFDGAADSKALEAYFQKAPGWYDECRALFAPYIMPADLLRLELDEMWSKGCSVERIGGRLTYVGLLRGFRSGAEARPHQDMTNWDLPEFPEAQSLLTQLSCLTYFACAESGGELELWGKRFDSRTEYEAHLAPGDYGLNRCLIGRPDASIRPGLGELIVFNARNIHAVSRIEKGHRFSQSFFIGYRGNELPLSVFS